MADSPAPPEPQPESQVLNLFLADLKAAQAFLDLPDAARLLGFLEVPGQGWLIWERLSFEHRLQLAKALGWVRHTSRGYRDL